MDFLLRGPPPQEEEEEKPKIPKNTKKQKKAAKKKLRALRKEEKRRLELIKKVKREQLLSNMNFGRVMKKWMEIIHIYKAQGLEEEVMELKDKLEHYLQAKDKQINEVIDGFVNLEEDRRRMHADYIEVLDKLLEMAEEKFKGVETKVRDELFKRKDEFLTELDRIREREDLAIEHLTLTIFQQQEMDELGEDALKDKFEEAMYDVSSEAWNRLDKLERELDDAIQHLLITVQLRIKSFLIFTKPKRKIVKSLRRKDDKYRIERDNDFKRIKFLKSELKLLRLSMDAVEERRLKVNELREEKQKIFENFGQLKKSLEKNRIDDRRQLKLLTVSAAKTIDNLKSRLALLCPIIRIKSQCHLYEDDTECCTQNIYLYRGNSSQLKMNRLDLFWEHLAKAEMSLTITKREYQAELQENEILKEVLGRFFHELKNSPL